MIIGKAKYKVGDKVKIISNVYDTMNCLDRYNKVLNSSKQNMQKYAGAIVEIIEVRPYADCVEYAIKDSPYIWIEELFENISCIKAKAIRITKQRKEFIDTYNYYKAMYELYDKKFDDVSDTLKRAVNKR